MSEANRDRASGADASVEALGFAEAARELDAILAELEDETIDVDRLGERVSRASALIGLCRRRIGAARMEVEHIIAGLDQPEAAEQ
ncbi:MAG: exodeoxyribonuclease VII small subunit [Acidimicrobiales bacterium]